MIYSKANAKWQSQLEDFQQTNAFGLMFGIDGEPTEWKISQDLHHWKLFERSKKTCKIETLNVKKLMIGSSACQCSMTSIGRREEIQKRDLCRECRGNHCERKKRIHGTMLQRERQERIGIILDRCTGSYRRKARFAVHCGACTTQISNFVGGHSTASPLFFVSPSANCKPVGAQRITQPVFFKDSRIMSTSTADLLSCSAVGLPTANK